MYRKILLICMMFLLLVSMAKADMSEDALLAIERAEETIKEMSEMGLGVAYANDTLNEARNLFNQGYYEASESLAKKVLEIKEKAIEVDELINQVESKIYELSSKGYDTSSVYVTFSSGLSEFSVDNYLDAENFMRDALNELDELEAEESLKRIQTREFDIVSVVLDYLWVVIILILLILIAGLKIKDKIDIKHLKGELESLEREMENIKKSLAAVQRRYFEKGSISKMDYDISVSRYNKTISVIKRKISVLNGKLKNH